VIFLKDDMADALIAENILTEKNRAHFVEHIFLPNFHQYQPEFTKEFNTGKKHKLKCLSKGGEDRNNQEEEVISNLGSDCEEEQREFQFEPEKAEQEEAFEEDRDEENKHEDLFDLESIDFDLDLDLESRKKVVKISVIICWLIF
jgi:hypothetical protein